MTAPQVPFDPPTQNQEQNQNQENQNQSSNSETQTQNNPDPVIDTVPRTEFNQTLESTHNLYRLALQEAETKRLETERLLAEARRNQQQSPAPIPDEELTPAQIIDRQIQASVAPLLQGFNQFQANQQQQNYQNIKNNFRQLPQFAPFFTQLEPFLDQEMQGKPITVEVVQNALATVIGRIQMQAALNPQNQNLNTNQQQMNNNPQQNQNQQQNQQQQNLPPHLRPSAPPLPNRSGNQNLTPGGNQRYQLTELQKRVAREQKLTDDQYIDWITVDPINVIHSDIGKPPRQS